MICRSSSRAALASDVLDVVVVVLRDRNMLLVSFVRNGEREEICNMPVGEANRFIAGPITRHAAAQQSAAAGSITVVAAVASRG